MGQASRPGAAKQGPFPPRQLQSLSSRGERPQEGQRSSTQNRGEAFRRHRKVQGRERFRFPSGRSSFQRILARAGILSNS